ncbi:MAG: type II toxin-antitoxin system RelE/ParE family toxin [Ignavibacteriae bacterium]|nr:type II toxin-antitoxin system RelE/ParE family toxin [Ignavibacteriota bacterium]
MYKILYSEKVKKEFDDLDNKTYLKIRQRIFSLEENPRPVGSLKLEKEEGYRIRQGDYRILYEIDDTNKIVRLLRIGHRKDVYR